MNYTHSFYLLVILSLCSFAACQSADDIDADFLTDIDLLNANFVDTLSLDATLQRAKPINLGAAQNNNVFLLGALEDPVFGKSTASLCMQFTLGTGQNNLSFDSIPQLDSVVLSLAFANDDSYGFVDEPQSFNIYEITDSLVFRNAASELVEYFTDTVCTVDQLVGTATVNFSQDSIMTMDTTLAPANTIRIRLDDALGEKFLTASQESNDSVFFNIVSFLNFFKGLAVIPEPDNSAIASFNLLSNNTNLSFYYKAYLPGQDTISERRKNFLVRAQTGTSSVLALNEFRHDYTNTAPQAILDVDGKVTDIGYLQGMAGVDIKIEVPSLFDLGDVFVNRAELEINNILEEISFDSIQFPQPAFVAFELLETDGTTLYDGGAEVTVFTDSVSTTRMNRYNIPLTLSLQRYLTEGKGNSELIVKILENPLNPYRLIINGPEATEFPMKLKLHYTTVE